MSEINLLKNYPKTKRNLSEASIQRTDEVRFVARKFDKDFFDGERKFGYGGYNYNPRFWTNVVKDFADHYNLRMTDLISARRARVIARPRQVAMFLSKMLTSKSLPEIGRRFGGRDHTTVIHAVKKIEELKQIDNQIAEEVEILRRMLEA